MNSKTKSIDLATLRQGQCWFCYVDDVIIAIVASYELASAVQEATGCGFDGPHNLDDVRHRDWRIGDDRNKLLSPQDRAECNLPAQSAHAWRKEGK